MWEKLWGQSGAEQGTQEGCSVLAGQKMMQKLVKSCL